MIKPSQMREALRMLEGKFAAQIDKELRAEFRRLAAAIAHDQA